MQGIKSKFVDLLRHNGAHCRAATRMTQKPISVFLRKKTGLLYEGCDINTTTCDQLITEYSKSVKEFQDTFQMPTTNLNKDIIDLAYETLSFERNAHKKLINECDFDSLKEMLQKKVDNYDACEKLLDVASRHNADFSNLDKTLGVHGAEELMRTYNYAAEIQSLYSTRDIMLNLENTNLPTSVQIRKDYEMNKEEGLLKMRADMMAMLATGLEYCKDMMNNLLYLRQGFFYAQHPQMLEIAQKEANNANYDLVFGPKFNELLTRP